MDIDDDGDHDLLWPAAAGRVSNARWVLATGFDLDEPVVLTVCHEPRTQPRSYELLAEAFEP